MKTRFENAIDEAIESAKENQIVGDLTDLCKKLEHWETDRWAADSILKKEILTGDVLDPCCGTGVLTTAARPYANNIISLDIHDWGFRDTIVQDFLADASFFGGRDFTVFMNPPFSLSEKFVDRSLELKARKIVCFQKFSWWEGSYDTGKKRGQWWEKNRPARIWICGDRADCWRHDIPLDQRNSSTPTAYAWFVWERGHIGTQIGHIYKRKEK